MQSNPHRTGIFGKVRNSMSKHGRDSRSESSGDLHTNRDGRLSTKAILPNLQVSYIDSLNKAPAKRRSSLWRKTQTNFKAAPSSVLPPALTLRFDEDKHDEMVGKHKLQMAPLVTEDSLARTTSKRESQMRSSSLTLTTSPAAAVAVAAASLVTPATASMQVKYHRNARLKVRQATELIQLCSQEIKMRGLATIGIFRPFRLSESLEQQERLIELFLLYSDPKQYENVFFISDSSSSAMLRDTMGKVNAESEFKAKLSYAKISDVVALLKWGLRRLQLQRVDVGSVDQLSWYDDFVQREKAANYPLRAYTELFLPAIPEQTRPLFTTVLELMSTISAHHIANAMSASRICKSLGYWFIGRIGLETYPHNLNSVVQSWERCNKVMEHLLMAYVRDESSRNHLMPSRLMEIVLDYPCIQSGDASPSLKPSFSSKPIKAMLVDVKSDNIAVPSKKARSPSETLRAALKAQGSLLESSEEVDDWSAILGVASTLHKPDRAVLDAYSGGLDDDDDLEPEVKESEEETDARKESALFEEDDARILRIISEEFEHRKFKSDGARRENLPSSNEHDVGGGEESGMRRFHSKGSEGQDWSFLRISSSVSRSQLHYSNSSSSHLTILQKDSPDQAKSTDPKEWKAFSSGGFAADGVSPAFDLKLNEAYKPKSALERAFEEGDEAARGLSMKRKGSLRTLRRKRPYRNQLGSISSSRLHDPESVRDGMVDLRPVPSSTLNGVSTLMFDEAFVQFWQDQVLDDCPAVRLPCFFIAQFNQSTSSQLLSSEMGKYADSNSWLIISECINPSRPSVPVCDASSNGKGLGMLRRMNNSIVGGFDAKVESDKRSLFAPSVRSTFSSRVEKTKTGLRRMSSIFSIGSVTGADRLKRQEEIDQEVQELREAVQTKRLQASSATLSKVEVISSSSATGRKKRLSLLAEDCDGPGTMLGDRRSYFTDQSSVMSKYQDAEEM
ncbi:hypothetical protein CBS101457_004691 [Exobasidium rhododendri]|nr:hypothetical protein CBS101457_004691 [Exobasidium rhododendri]